MIIHSSVISQVNSAKDKTQADCFRYIAKIERDKSNEATNSNTQ